MKNLIVIILFLLPVLSHGQKVIEQGARREMYRWRGGIAADSALQIPVRDTGAITYWGSAKAYLTFRPQDSLVYLNDGRRWKAIGAPGVITSTDSNLYVTITRLSDSLNPIWDAIASIPPAWNLNGNYGTTPGTHFIGTNDAQDLQLRTDGSTRMTLYANGSFTGQITSGVNSAFLAYAPTYATMSHSHDGSFQTSMVTNDASAIISSTRGSADTETVVELYPDALLLQAPKYNGALVISHLAHGSYDSVAVFAGDTLKKSPGPQYGLFTASGDGVNAYVDVALPVTPAWVMVGAGNLLASNIIWWEIITGGVRIYLSIPAAFGINNFTYWINYRP